MPSYRRRRRREVPPVELDLNGLFGGMIGADGLHADELAPLEPALIAARAAVWETPVGFADLGRRRDELREVQELTVNLLGRYDTIVVLGTGASAVGARWLGTARPPGRIRRPRLIVADSIDPVAVEDLLRKLDLKRTLFNVVSQSGDAAETMSLFMIVRDRLLRELGAVDYREHVVVTTDAERGSLRQIVNDEGFRALPIAPDAQGAFGLLTPTGTFAASMTGIDVEELLEGAATMADRCAAAATPLEDPAALLAACCSALATHHRGRGLAVVPFSVSVSPVAEWLSQLWPTPVGIVRYTELVRHYDTGGFGDRVLLLIRPRDGATEMDTPVAYQDLADVGYLGGHTLGEVLRAEAESAAYLLARRGHPSLTLTLPAVTAGAIGQTALLFQAAAAILARLDTAAEGAAATDADESRRVLGALLGRAGTDAERDELTAWRGRRDPRYIV